MSSPSEHPLSYLDYYSALIRPEFAVMVQGEWGSGKSYLVRNYFKPENIGKTWLNISLYGVTKLEQIDSIIFSQLHPILSSKTAEVVGKIAKGLLRAGIKIDLDDKHTATGSPALPDINSSDLFSNDTSGLLLVFDDIERCTSINPVDLFGYINHFVEHVGCRVVIIANERELRKNFSLLNHAADAPKYQPFKSKIVGKDIAVSANFNDATDSFIGEITNSESRIFLLEHKQSIGAVFTESGTNNLRVLRQSIYHFDRVYSLIPQEYKDHKIATSQLLKYFICFSMEVRDGLIGARSLETISPYERGEDAPYALLRSKYPTLDFNHPVISYAYWSKIFENGILSPEDIASALDACSYFKKKSRPLWLKLWYCWDLDNSDLTALLKEVMTALNTHDFKHSGEVVHIAGVLHWLSRENAIDLQSDCIMRLAKKSIEAACSGKYPDDDDFRDNRFWGSHGIHDSETPAIRDLIVFSLEEHNKARTKQYPEIAKELAAHLKSAPEKFLALTCLSAGEDRTFTDAPVLGYIDTSDVISSIANATQDKRRVIGTALKNRYMQSGHIQELTPESDWLSKLADDLLKRSEEMGGWDGVKLRKFREEYLLPAVAHFDEHRKLSPT